MNTYRIHYFYAATGEYMNQDVAEVKANSEEEALQKYIDQYKNDKIVYKWYNETARDILKVRIKGTSLKGMREEGPTHKLDKLNLKYID